MINYSEFSDSCEKIGLEETRKKFGFKQQHADIKYEGIQSEYALRKHRPRTTREARKDTETPELNKLEKMAAKIDKRRKSLVGRVLATCHVI